MSALLSRLRYFVADAADEWRSNPGVNALATATLASVLFAAGLVLLVVHNVRVRLETWQRDVRVEVYLEDSATDEARDGIRHRLSASPGVSRVAFVTKEEALDRFRRSFGSLADLVPELGENPLPQSFEAFLVPGAGAAAAARSVASSLRGVPGVEDVRFDLEWLDRLDASLRLARAGGAAAALAVLSVVVLVIAGVVRLAVHARREEIDVMLLVGASPALVRGPFLVSGIAQGLAAATIGIVLSEASRRLFLSWAKAAPRAVVDLVASQPLSLRHGLLLAAVGVSVGTAAAWVAVRRASRLP